MEVLKLITGPKLIQTRWVYDDEAEVGAYEDFDVTADAHAYLFQPVVLDDSVTLNDIFALVAGNPILRAIERRNFIEEMLEEVSKGVNPSYKPGYDPEGIEYLELYQVWNFNSATSTYNIWSNLGFHGIGFELKEDLNNQGGFTYPAGERIHWGISCSNIRDLLALPVRYKAAIPVCEDNIDSKKFGDLLTTVNVPDICLGQVIHGVMWELSFHGGPKETAEVISSLKKQVDDIKKGTAKTSSFESLFEDSNRASCNALFDTIGDVPPYTVYKALRDFEDDAVVSFAFKEVFGDKVVVKAEFAPLTAIEFRPKFRAAEKS